MDVIYIVACLMQLDYILTHKTEGIFDFLKKIYPSIIYLNLGTDPGCP